MILQRYFMIVHFTKQTILPIIQNSNTHYSYIILNKTMVPIILWK